MGQIFSYEQLERYKKEVMVCEDNPQTKEEFAAMQNDYIHNHVLIVDSHLALQERNERLRKANHTLVEIIKSIKGILKLKR